MVKWEYKLLRYSPGKDSGVLYELMKLGEEGWELVSAFSTKEDPLVNAYLKRVVE